MKVKGLISLLLTGLVAAAIVAPAGVAGAKAAKPLAVGTDAAGDWGAAVDPNIGPLGDALGQDLVGAEIVQDGANVNFVIKLNSLPPSGGAPEISRYTWNFFVDKTPFELDGKFTNYSRGVCDPTAGTCPPPRDPGTQPFFLRGNCGENDLVATTFTACEELEKIQATFDAASGTITIPVSATALKAKKGSKIIPGTNIFGGSISAAPSAFLTSSAFPIDTLTATKTFVVR